MIAVIDYGAGNLGSVCKAFNYLGMEAVITKDKNKINNASAVILPGVGAFEDAMKSLEKDEMSFTIKEIIKKGVPFLAICLGLQVLFDYSEEGNRIDGLTIFKGTNKKIPSMDGLKVPHMGWNKLIIENECPLYKGFHEDIYVYFVHSYALEAEDRSIVSARAEYGITFDASVYKDNVFATQFHPEKSGKIGLKMLENFISII